MPQHERDEELAMMRDPDKWPHVFLLPLIKRGENVTGFLFQGSVRTPCPPPEPVIRIGNMFDSERVKIDDFPKQRYESLEAIYDDGWRVD